MSITSFTCSILTLTLSNIPLLSWTPGNNSILLKYTTTYATVDQGIVHELRPRLFLTFVVNSLPFWSNSGSLRSYSTQSLTFCILPRNIWNLLSQIVSDHLWWVLWYFKEFKNAKLDKWKKILLSLRFSPQTMSPYIQKSDGLCTRTDHHMLLPIVLHMVVPLCLKMQ